MPSPIWRRQRGALATCITLLAACSATPPSAEPASDDLRAGQLGHPLGTYLTVGGVRDTSGKTGPGSLLVDTVNGARLAKPVPIWVDDVDLARGERVELAGYESGRFIGTPPEVARVTGVMTQAAWQFQRYFVATSIEQGGTRR